VRQNQTIIADMAKDAIAFIDEAASVVDNT
jgi:hypothetical protein